MIFFIEQRMNGQNIFPLDLATLGSWFNFASYRSAHTTDFIDDIILKAVGWPIVVRGGTYKYVLGTEKEERRVALLLIFFSFSLLPLSAMQTVTGLRLIILLKRRWRLNANRSRISCSSSLFYTKNLSEPSLSNTWLDLIHHHFRRIRQRWASIYEKYSFNDSIIYIFSWTFFRKSFENYIFQQLFQNCWFFFAQITLSE